MDGTVVNVAMPTLSRSFGAPIGSVSGVVTAYLVMLAEAMPASGWIGDRFGGRGGSSTSTCRSARSRSSWCSASCTSPKTSA